MSKNDKILNNSFNANEGDYQDYTSPIAVNSQVSDRYEESTTDNMMGVLNKKNINELIYSIYVDSKFLEKYGKSYKKIEKSDIPDIYYYFKEEMEKNKIYTITEIFLGIVEFFELNYNVMYNDIISIQDKEKILDEMTEMYGLNKKLSCKKLF